MHSNFNDGLSSLARKTLWCYLCVRPLVSLSVCLLRSLTWAIFLLRWWWKRQTFHKTANDLFVTKFLPNFYIWCNLIESRSCDLRPMSKAATRLAASFAHQFLWTFLFACISCFLDFSDHWNNFIITFSTLPESFVVYFKETSSRVSQKPWIFGKICTIHNLDPIIDGPSVTHHIDQSLAVCFRCGWLWWPIIGAQVTYFSPSKTASAIGVCVEPRPLKGRKCLGPVMIRAIHPCDQYGRFWQVKLTAKMVCGCHRLWRWLMQLAASTWFTRCWASPAFEAHSVYCWKKTAEFVAEEGLSWFCYCWNNSWLLYALSWLQNSWLRRKLTISCCLLTLWQ